MQRLLEDKSWSFLGLMRGMSSWVFGPFYTNTRLKLLRMIGYVPKKQTHQGYFKSFFDSAMGGQQKSRMSWANPIKNTKQQLKRKIIYYVSILLGIIILFKAAPGILAGLFSRPSAAPKGDLQIL